MHNLIEILRDPPDPEVYSLGSWFLVPEAAIKDKGTKEHFAHAKAEGSGQRPVVLASPWDRPDWGPNASIFPRSTQDQEKSQDVYRHEPHSHRGESPPCNVNKCGWVLLHLPVNVDANEMHPGNWSCVEPKASGLYAELQKRLR